MKKRLFSIVIALAMLCAMLPTVPIIADAATASGKYGTNLTYTLTSDGVLTISGTGNMYNYTYPSSSDYPWYNYCSSVKQVVIEEGVTSIADYAFDYYANLTSVSLPSSLNSIGSYAFRQSGLTSVTIPEGVQTIGKRAFEACGKLTTASVPNSVTTLGEAAFIYCGKLTSVTLGYGITEIPEDAFYYCTSLKNVNIPDGVTSIGYSAFAWTAIESVIIPDGVTSIGKYAFQACNSLTQVSIPANVAEIGDRAFLSCKLLTGISVASDNPSYSSDSKGVLFDKNKQTLICAPTAMTGVYAVPDTVKTIREYAFKTCTVSNVTIPEGVTEIGDEAFYNCSNLMAVTVPDSVATMGDWVFYLCPKLSYTEYDNTKYLGNTNNPYVVLVTAVSTSITSCSVHPQTKFIDTYAFYKCTQMAEFFMQDSVIGIAQDAFRNCSRLSNVVYCGTEEQWEQISMGYNSYLTNAARSYHKAEGATCAEAAVCTVCGDRVGEPLGHSGEWMALVEPTCTEAGIEVRICETCGTTESRDIEATGHSGDSVVTSPTCTEQGYTTTTCTVCGGVTVTDYVDAIGHTWTAWITAKAPTCTTEGSQMRMCTVCKTKETATVEKTPHTCENGICTACGVLESYNWVLTADAAAELSLTEDLYVDLNGHDLSGTITTNGYKVYGMDSATNEYACDTMGYFTCVDVNGNAIVPEGLYTTADMAHYMTIETDSGYTFHRFYLGITNVSLAPMVTGFGYKAEFYGDEMVQAQIVSVGFDLWITEGHVVSRTTDFKNSLTLRLKNFDAANYGETPVNARATMTLVDDTVITGTDHSHTLRDAVESVNENYTDYSCAKLAAVCDMIANDPTMQTWAVDNIWKKEL